MAGQAGAKGTNSLHKGWSIETPLGARRRAFGKREAHAMRTTFVETVRAGLALPAAVIFAYLAVLMLIGYSIIQVLLTIKDLITTIENVHNFGMTAALTVMLVPAACVLFWSGKALLICVENVLKKL